MYRVDWDQVQQRLPLSKRELEVTRLVVAGLPETAIARHLGIGLGTVKTYKRRIYHKLRVNDRTGLALALVPPPRGSGPVFPPAPGGSPVG